MSLKPTTRLLLAGRSPRSSKQRKKIADGIRFSRARGLGGLAKDTKKRLGALNLAGR